MNKEINRRDFIKGAAGCGAFLLLTTVTPNVAFGRSKRVKLKIKVKSGRRGCRHCGNTVKKLLKDRKMMSELEDMFPPGATVTFYVKSQNPNMKVPENGIVVGGCARAIKSKADVFVPGCRRQITKEAIFNAIKKKYKSKI